MRSISAIVLTALAILFSFMYRFFFDEAHLLISHSNFRCSMNDAVLLRQFENVPWFPLSATMPSSYDALLYSLFFGSFDVIRVKSTSRESLEFAVRHVEKSFLLLYRKH